MWETKDFKVKRPEKETIFVDGSSYVERETENAGPHREIMHLSTYKQSRDHCCVFKSDPIRCQLPSKATRSACTVETLI